MTNADDTKTTPTDQSYSAEGVGLGDPKVISVRYTNHRGITEVRQIVPTTIWFGKSQYHEGEQWFMEAVALDRDGATRDFALSDMEFVRGSEG